MQLDSHALGLEESRNWSRLFTDADAVFVRDKRSGGDLVLTVGDSRVVTVSSVFLEDAPISANCSFCLSTSPFCFTSICARICGKVKT